jgi:hypothetical protein
VTYISEAPAMDISRGDEQDRIADGLIAPLDGSPLQDDFDNGLSGGVATDTGEGYEEPETTDEINADLREEIQEIEAESESEQPAEEFEAEQPEVTAQSIQETIASLDQNVTEMGMNDPVAATTFAASIGVDPAAAQPMGQTIQKSALSALEVYQAAEGDLSKVGPIPPGPAAEAFKNDWEINVMQVDPRTSPASAEQLATWKMSVDLSIIAAIAEKGLDAPLHELNTLEAAQVGINALLAMYGATQGVDAGTALKWADAYTEFVRSGLRQYAAHQQEQQPRRSSGRSRSSRQADYEDNDHQFLDDPNSWNEGPAKRL